MNAKQRWPKPSRAAVLATLAITLVAIAVISSKVDEIWGQTDFERRLLREAVFTGGYFCAFHEASRTIDHSVTFTALGLPGNEPSLDIAPLGPGSFADCEGLAARFAERAGALGCSVRVVPRETNIDVRFVCEGPVNPMIAAVAELSRWVLLALPETVK